MGLTARSASVRFPRAMKTSGWQSVIQYTSPRGSLSVMDTFAKRFHCEERDT